MLTFYQPPPKISRGDPQPRLGAELMESHVVPAHAHCCPTLTLETALLLLWCNSPSTLCFPAPSPSCRSFEQNTSLRTFILRCFSVYTSATAQRLHAGCSQTSKQNSAAQCAKSSLGFARHIGRDASSTHIFCGLDTASSRSSIASPVITRTRPSFTTHPFAILTHKNSTTNQRRTSISCLSIPTTSRNSNSDSHSTCTDNKPTDTHNIFWTKCRSNTGYGRRNRLRLRSRLPSTPLADIYLFRPQ